MSPGARSSGAGKRSRQACLNCRRKKIRCPGERPACSTCHRLGQACRYKSVERPSSFYSGSHRIAHLEQKLEFVLSQVTYLIPCFSDDSSAVQEDTPSNADDAEPPYQQFPEPQGSPDSNFLPSAPIIDNALDLYFQNVHRHPIWCFNREDVEDPGSVSRELICAILALTSRFSDPKGSLAYYSGTTRTLIMLHLANGTVTLPTIESICLLSYSHSIDGDLQQARFYLGLAQQLCNCAGLDQESPRFAEDASRERKKRLFWSVKLLQYSYGRDTPVLDSLSDMTRPVYARTESQDIQVLATPKPPSSPSDPACLDDRTTDPGMWWIMVQITCIWSKAREYVLECASDSMLKPPWHHRSTYAATLSTLAELENQIPMCIRYDSAKFYQRTAEDVAINLPFWYPWLRGQFTFHTTHVVLNHPFMYVYASQRNRSLEVPNTFWRKSLELALLHASWIVRLLDMALEKQMKLMDPFFVQASAIAASVHLYFCCVTDGRLRSKSKIDLVKCRGFLRSCKSYSAAAESLDSALTELVHIASGREDCDLHDWSPSSIRLNTNLMWNILQSNYERGSTQRPRTASSLLHSSLDPSASHQSTRADSILEVMVTVSPDINLDTSDGGQSAPVSSVTVGESIADVEMPEDTGHTAGKPNDNATVVVSDPLGVYDHGLSWLWADEIMNYNAQGDAGDIVGSDWWANGNW
ncbi:hypothetical protein CC80DRAFT_570985 [Byssothecium circinans]|uniref:Zn(2)-C6 fungal-type domain-containing protein n=1 Tax=Byssothecium circinans TaxID=147558 RepID=A0A6A5TK69_9PLEO|nr:hypothetical protein CC80DRAFT_570985 [Byssothecium circinans]